MENITDVIGWLSKITNRGTLYSYFRGKGYLKAPTCGMTSLNSQNPLEYGYSEVRHDSEVAVWLMTLQDLTKSATLHPEFQWCLSHSELDELRILLLLEHIGKFGGVTLADVLPRLSAFLANAFRYRADSSCPALIVQVYHYLTLRGHCELTNDWDLVTLIQLEESIPSLKSCVSCIPISKQLQGIADISSASELQALQLTLKKGRMGITDYCDLAKAITNVYASGM